MNRRIERSAQFRNDLLDIYVRLAERDTEIARRFVFSVRDDSHKLRDMPRMGAIRYFRNRKYRNVRSWPISGFGKFLLFYRPVEEGIQVIRIVHGARDLRKLFR